MFAQTFTPLLGQPPQVRHTLYWHMSEGSNAPLLCLDGSPHIMPPPPTWREYLDSVCASLSRAATFENVDMWRRVYNVEPDQLDLPMDAAKWQRDFDFINGPHARASSVLGAIHLGPALDRIYLGPELGRGPRGEQRPHVNFNGPGIGDARCARWITASDMLALSLLQARLRTRTADQSRAVER